MIWGMGTGFLFVRHKNLKDWRRDCDLHCFLVLRSLGGDVIYYIFSYLPQFQLDPGCRVLLRFRPHLDHLRSYLILLRCYYTKLWGGDSNLSQMEPGCFSIFDHLHWGRTHASRGRLRYVGFFSLVGSLRVLSFLGWCSQACRGHYSGF